MKTLTELEIAALVAAAIPKIINFYIAWNNKIWREYVNK